MIDAKGGYVGCSFVKSILWKIRSLIITLCLCICCMLSTPGARATDSVIRSFILLLMIVLLQTIIKLQVNFHPGPEVVKLFSCSAQLIMKFSLLINMKMPTIVGIFILISRESFMLSNVYKKLFAITSDLRVISRTNFVLSGVEHEKKNITLG